ncbi:MAG: hydantoinase B/oxoprolinase family protein [Rhodospirillales bacterium]|jgi:N-methylhydantoinase B|nr:hydantoinase B/oxoprolinase family protein [Rhodospirillales bacterium]MBT4041084.1 hydantoinase B/oxoprolinase family protein [Rhodospirillales bacterium]MBT4628407.1 hydantoinase B/oxoprolinase family protein [Rhodospirillales bacterium]MBT5350824.1 hydantoinase B/oxoprolinase family protein [Rhodospirillales bacterium]MBT5522354.1 hydantoinase B/oxoprolinase family protein [Rhodospirillales bacterium]
MSVDVISRDIFQHELIGIAEEMSVSLRHSAFSSIIWDMYDYACGLMLPNGDMISQAQTIPAQLGVMPTAVHHMFDVFPVDTWVDGDIIVCNDPYRGCTHTPDICLFSPVYVDGEIVAISSTIAHHIDVGGKVPGTEAADNKEIFEEGLVLPPVKIMEAGKPVKAIFDIIANNVRDPRASAGDLRAQIAGCRTGERRIRDLCKRYGIEGFKELAAGCLDYSETYISRSIEDIGDRVSEAVVLIEDEMASEEPIRLQLKTWIENGRLVLDFGGSSEQRANGLNCPISSTISMVHFGVKAIFASDLPQNSGINRPLDIRVPDGCVLSPIHPAAVSARHITENAVSDLVIKTLSPLSPETASGGAHSSFPTFVAGGVDDRAGSVKPGEPAQYSMISDMLGGGMGGYDGHDGMSAIDTHGGNCQLLSAEIMEAMSPVRVIRSELVPSSGGDGKYRGGLAIRRDYEILSSAAVVSGYLQQSTDETASWGFNGGEGGGKSLALLNPDTNHETNLRSKFVGLELKKGERFRLQAAGGGGWGKPEERSQDLIDRDIEEGYVSSV